MGGVSLDHYRKFFKTIVFPAVCLLFPVIFPACAGKHYNPYGKKQDIPPASYEGRIKNRYYASDRFEEPTKPSVEEYRMEGKKFPPEAQIELIEDTTLFPENAGYLLGPGDVLEIIYQLRYVKQEEDYKITLQDEIDIEFFFTPTLNKRCTVRIDGKISAPLVGDIDCYGKTAEEIKKDLIEKYSAILKEPEINIYVVKSNWAVEELKRAITTAPRGQSRLEPVRPDGYISLPLIGDVLVGGLTVPLASQSIREKYQSIGVMDVDVTVVLLEAKSSVAYVIGEILNPGPIDVQARNDVWRAIASAGGFTENADKNHVIVAKTKGSSEQRFVFDFDLWRSKLESSENTMIRRGDVIYVPKKKDTFIYILGAIEKPGRFKLESDTMMTVSQALSVGGKIDSGANEGQVLVLRRTQQNEPIILSVDTKALFNPKNYKDENDYPPRDPVLQEGDIVYVPNRFVGNLDSFAEAWFKNGIWTIIPFSIVAGI
ncbi:polysaccharide biosynthesis/export family protein [Candidatus Sumerlaeota bacterium]|nr:polysaccharide biosynthesis/export family protein [Candidatus Sumerlaeota bacterium]